MEKPQLVDTGVDFDPSVDYLKQATGGGEQNPVRDLDAVSVLELLEGGRPSVDRTPVLVGSSEAAQRMPDTLGVSSATEGVEPVKEPAQEEHFPLESREQKVADKIHSLETELEALVKAGMEKGESPEKGLIETISQHIKWWTKFMEWMENPLGVEPPSLRESPSAEKKKEKVVSPREGISKWRMETLTTLDTLVENLPRGIEPRTLAQFEKFATTMNDYDYAIFTKNIERLKDEYRSSGDRPALDQGLTNLFRDPLKGLEGKKK